MNTRKTLGLSVNRPVRCLGNGKLPETRLSRKLASAPGSARYTIAKCLPIIAQHLPQDEQKTAWLNHRSRSHLLNVRTTTCPPHARSTDFPQRFFFMVTPLVSTARFVCCAPQCPRDYHGHLQAQRANCRNFRNPENRVLSGAKDYWHQRRPARSHLS
jgi:hypothetical protein